MKLLGWMHREFRQNSTEPFKDLVIGQAAAVDEKHRYYYYPKQNFGSCKHVKQTQKEQEAWGGNEQQLTRNTGTIIFFPGFLAIGTLGSGSDPSSTPTVENIITEKEDEVSENELKMINNDLEKVLVVTNNNVNDDSSSGRNSTGRGSHAGRRSSIITPESNAICPLQGYLFGSAVETTTTTVSKQQQQQHSHRTSLAELFHISKAADEEKLVGAKDDKKKLKKKRMLLHSADRKVHNKILHIFHKKVHPENPILSAEEIIKKKRMNEVGVAIAKEKIGRESKKKRQSNFTENKEHWIKTDADYLVLEL